MASKVISDQAAMPMHCGGASSSKPLPPPPPPEAAAAASCSTNPPPPPPADEKKKRKHAIFEADPPKKKKQKRMKYPQVPTSDLSPEFMKIIGPCVPFFLYRKKLSGSDVVRQQNRLLVTEEERVVDEFLTEEERKKFKEGPVGVTIDVMAFDVKENDYKVCLTKWETMIVFNNGWRKLVEANKAEAGHWVDLWGFRRDDGKFRLAVNFTK